MSAMPLLKTIVTDDEPLALDYLVSCLQSNPAIEVIARCSNGYETLAACETLQPDLLLLDVQMPGLSGFDVAKQLQMNDTPLIIFVTAYDQYALKAFDAHAVDYLLKPVEPNKLSRAITRCEQLVKHTTSDPKQATRVLDAIHSLPEIGKSSRQAQKTTAEKIAIKDGNQMLLIDPHTIDWIEAAGDYVCIHAQGETHIVRQTMREVARSLDQTLFARVHRSTIVNLTRIKSVQPHTKGEFFVELGEGQSVKVSRTYRAQVADYINARKLKSA